MTRARKFPSVLWTTLFILAGLPIFSTFSIAFSDDSEKLSPYDQVWQQVSQLLEVREYASALELIDDAKNDAELGSSKDRLAADRKDIQGLQRLASLVRDRASKLKPDVPFKDGNIEYKVIRFVSDAQGDRLMLESLPGSTKIERPLNELEPKSWLALAQPKLTTSAEDRYIVGVFQASVADGDRKAARQILNLAAMDKISVTHWTSRIDAETQSKDNERNEKKAELDDRILGTWRMVIGEGKGERRINITFRPRGKTDQRTSTWRKVGEADYVLSAPHGATARISLGPKGEGFRGKTANGTPVKGTRQAKAKR